MNWLAQSYPHFLPLLADSAAKSAVLLALALLLGLAQRKSSAALRHLTCALALAGALLVPVLSSLLPAWQVPGLRDWRAEWAPPARKVAVAVPMAASAPGNITFMNPDATRANDPRNYQGTILPTGEIVPRKDVPVASKISGGKKGFDWKQFLLRNAMVLWLAGAVAALAPLLMGCRQVARLTRRCVPVTDDAWAEALARAGADLQLRRRVDLRWGPGVPAPLTWGAWRPVLLLPAEAAAWTAARRRVVLLHELAHVKRADWLTQTAATAACAAYWYNPLAWLALRRMRVERERACDDWVLRNGPRASEYAGELLAFAARAGEGGLLSWAMVPMVRKSSLEDRLLAILDARRNRASLTRFIITLACMLAAVIIIPVAMLRGQGVPGADGAPATTQQGNNDKPLPSAAAPTVTLIGAVNQPGAYFIDPPGTNATLKWLIGEAADGPAKNAGSYVEIYRRDATGKRALLAVVGLVAELNGTGPEVLLRGGDVVVVDAGATARQNQLSISLDGAFPEPGVSPPAATADIASFTEASQLAAKGDREQLNMEYAAALDDLNHALQLEPSNWNALFTRGWVKWNEGDLAGAMADYDDLIKRKPDATDALFKRGLIKECQGDYAGALADFDRILSISGTSLYSQINRQLLLLRLGRPLDGLAEKAAAWPDMWPKAFAEFMVGKVSEAQLIEEAGKNGEFCEVNYFLGVYKSAKGDVAGAEEAFKNAADSANTSHNEYTAAKAELERLQAQKKPTDAPTVNGPLQTQVALQFGSGTPGGGTMSLARNGSGTFTLNGANPDSGNPTTNSGTQVTSGSPASHPVKLSSLDLSAWGPRPGAPTFAWGNQERMSRTVKIGDQEFADAVSMRAGGPLFLKLDGGTDKFTATIGMDNISQERGTNTDGDPLVVYFRVLGDGKLLYESAPVIQGDAPLHISVDTKGVEMLGLEVEPAVEYKSGNRDAHWADATFEVSGAQPQAVEAPVGSASADLQKLRSIIIPSVNIDVPTPLDQVAAVLKDLSVKFDPEGQGVNIVVYPPAGGREMPKVTLKNLTNLSLDKLLEIACENAQPQPYVSTVEDGVITLKESKAATVSGGSPTGNQGGQAKADPFAEATAAIAIPEGTPDQRGLVEAFIVQGDVQIIDQDGRATALVRGVPFTAEGDTIKTGPKSQALLVFSNGATVKLLDNSTLKVTLFRQAPFDEQAEGTFLRLSRDPSRSNTILDVSSDTLQGGVKQLNKAAGSTFIVNGPHGPVNMDGNIGSSIQLQGNAAVNSGNLSVSADHFTVNPPGGTVAASNVVIAGPNGVQLTK